LPSSSAEACLAYNLSIERTSKSLLRSLLSAAHVER
jgi:hypothetical protein